MTTTATYTQLVSVYAAKASTSYTPGGGAVERVDQNTTGSGAVTLSVTDRALTTTGASGTTAATSAATGVPANITIALTPLVTSRVDRTSYTATGDTADATLDGTSAVTERFITLPGGVLVTKRAAGDVWSYPNIHGDIVATTNSAGVKQGATTFYDPYGNKLTGPTPDNQAGKITNAWLGQHQRPTENETGLQPIVEMGARGYSPTLGRFLELDPVEGGTSNDYNYVNDPINEYDLNGMWGLPKWAKGVAKGVAKFVVKHADAISAVAGTLTILGCAICAPIAMAASAISAAKSCSSGVNAGCIVGVASLVVPFGAGKVAGRYATQAKMLKTFKKGLPLSVGTRQGINSASRSLAARGAALRVFKKRSEVAFAAWDTNSAGEQYFGN